MDFSRYPCLVYNTDIRGGGTDTYVWDAMRRGLGYGDTLRRYRPDGKLPPHSFYIYVDDGRDDITWECPKPNAYWAIDTHLGFDYRLWKARQFDYVFCAQREGAQRMRSHGVNAFWLPLACHPPAHPNREELMGHEERPRFDREGGFDKRFDVVFVGFINEGAGPNSNNRLEFLDFLFRECPNFWLTTNCFHEDMAIRYVRGRVGFNLSIRNDLNMRAFEVPSTGTCMLSNTTIDGLEAVDLIPGMDFLPFTDQKEMLAQVAWALKNPLERETIARRGHEKVRSRHTYAHRAALLLKTCGIEMPPGAEQLADGGFVGHKGLSEKAMGGT